MLILCQQAVQASEWANTTRFDFPSYLVLALAVAVSVWDVRQYWWVLIGSVVFVTPAQRLVVAGQDFSTLRLVVIVGLVACLFWGRKLWDSRERLDILVALLAVWHVVIGLLRPEISPLSRVGSSIDTFGSYMICRSLLRSKEDLARLGVAASWIALLSLPFYIYEAVTARSAFSSFGGVPKTAVIRRGIPRCQGSFSHSIPSGLFFALLMPVMLSVKSEVASGRARIFLWLAVGASAFVVLASNSSTPASAILIVGLLFVMRPWRRLLGFAALAAILASIPLHFISGRGIHAVLARADIVSGSTGWHRYNLIEAAMRHFDDWAAFGIESTAHWGWYLGDVTNEYLVNGVKSGFLGLLLSVWIMASAARQSWHASLRPGKSEWRRAYWVFIGVLGLAASMISVSMFSGLAVMQSILLAMVISLRDKPFDAGEIPAASSSSLPRKAGAEDCVPRLHGKCNL